MRLMPTRGYLPLMLCAAALSLVGCGKSGSSASGGSDGDAAVVAKTAPASKLTAQELYDAKRYSEAKAKALEEAQNENGHDREVSMLTAGLSAHAMQQYDDATTILTPLTRSEDSRISGRAKSALDYIGIERGRKSAMGTPLHPASGKRADPWATVPNAGPMGAKGYTLQAGVFASADNAKKRAAQVRNQAVTSGLGEPRIVPDRVQGAPAYAVQVGTFASKEAANAAKVRFGGQMVVMATP